jgi:hypothetical protein
MKLHKSGTVEVRSVKVYLLAPRHHIRSPPHPERIDLSVLTCEGLQPIRRTHSIVRRRVPVFHPQHALSGRSELNITLISRHRCRRQKRPFEIDVSPYKLQTGFLCLSSAQGPASRPCVESRAPGMTDPAASKAVDESRVNHLSGIEPSAPSQS